MGTISDVMFHSNSIPLHVSKSKEVGNTTVEESGGKWKSIWLRRAWSKLPKFFF